ncbi:zinc-dependent alcohol dehydrogenase family protein [Variovorax boronicumulans]|uniref:zinc-dependent alcohol dehydrogenase family protein n=1 Tax=Variovorax boronicumulans TaxID=436515 RepID=UPI001C58EA7A
MKAMVLRKPGGLDRIEQVERPAPGQPAASEIRVRVQASSLNYHDLGVAIGRSPVSDGRILLGDGAGIVEAVGSDITDFAPGDLVVGSAFPQWRSGPPFVSSFAETPGDGVDGFACSFMTAPARGFTHAPAGYSAAEAGTVTTAGVTAWRALQVHGPLKPGETVLVQGSGGVSVYALQIAKAAGATVIATSSSDDKLDVLARLGADHLINYRTRPDWGQAALDWTDGKGVDHVLDVGGPATIGQSITAVRVGGHIAVIGVLGGLSGELSFIPVLAKQIRMQGCLNGNYQDQVDLIAFLEEHRIRPVLDKRTFKVEQLAEAFAYQQSGAHFGKIVLEI